MNASVGKRKSFTTRLITLILLFQICFFSAQVWAEEIPVPPGEPLPHESIQLLGSEVDELVAQNFLTLGQGNALNTKLDHTHSELNQANALLAISHLESFKHQLEGLVQGGVLTDSQAFPLIGKATATQARIDTLAFGLWQAEPRPPDLAGCIEPVPCEYTIYIVDAHVRFEGAPDGSLARPFATITAALDSAADNDLCGVEIWVTDGHYDGDLLLSRNTRIIGFSQAGRENVVISGSILNNGGYELTVRNVTIRESSAPGAIVMDAPCATTLVSGVLIDRAERYGIFQRGGALTVSGSDIQGTRAQADTVSAGTGIYLSGGAQVVLNSISIARNESAALVATGVDTRVYGNDMTVTSTGINPHFRDELTYFSYAGFSAVEAKNGALLLMEYGRLISNELIGLLVHNGAQAHLRNTIISNTRSVEDDFHNSLGGTNVVAVEATLEINNFTLNFAQFAGLIANKAYVTLFDGEVSHNVVGVGVEPPDDPDCDFACLDQVVPRHNELNYYGPLSVPEPPPCQGCPAPELDCRTVPFSCEWCGEGL